MMELDPEGKAPILSYNVPEPTSYSGRNGIALDLGEEDGSNVVFTEAAFVVPDRASIAQMRDVSAGRVADALRLGNEQFFPNIKAPAATHAGLFSGQLAVHASDGTLDIATISVLARGLRARAVQADLSALTDPAGEPAGRAQMKLPQAVRGSVLAGPSLADQAERPHLTDLDIEHITDQLKAGKRLNVFRTLWGEYAHSFLPEPVKAHPQIVIMETYRLSSFLGQYGAGRTLNTFSLLPGEKTTISVKTFRKSASDSKSASSVLDSFTKESADDFENSVQNEQSDKKASQGSFEYHAEAEANVSWGFGSAKVSGGVKGGTASQREEFSKNISNAVNKHASKASSKRDVQVNTSSEVKEESGEETSITRQLENINVGRTLNFIFRQLNQEHITLLHLVDTRVAFWNGYSESVEEVPLPKLDGLIEKYIQPDRREEIRELILDQLNTVYDYDDKLVDPPIIEKKKVAVGDSYWRFRKSHKSTYTDETGNQITVPGVILSANKIVMRTEGVIVDAILGQGNALDDYSAGLQLSAVKQRELENKVRENRIDREILGRGIITDTDADKAAIYAQVFPTAVALPGKITVSVTDDDIAVSTEVSDE